MTWEAWERWNALCDADPYGVGPRLSFEERAVLWTEVMDALGGHGVAAVETDFRGLVLAADGRRPRPGPCRRGAMVECLAWAKAHGGYASPASWREFGQAITWKEVGNVVGWRRVPSVRGGDPAWLPSLEEMQEVWEAWR